MKKGKVIALALAAGITFMGAGYASWTDSVTIQSTVSTGNLDVDFVSPANTDLFTNDSYCSGSVAFTAYENETADDNGATEIVTVTANDLYPGGPKVEETFTLKNTGTLKVELDESHEDSAFQGALTLKDETVISLGNEMPQGVVFEIKVGDDVITNINDIGNLLDLEPEATQTVSVSIYLEESAQNELEEANFSFTFSPQFGQYNVVD